MRKSTSKRGARKGATRKTSRKPATRGRGMTRKDGARIWTKAEERLLKQKYKNTPTTEIAKELNRSLSSVRSKAVTMSLKKSPAKRTRTTGRGVKRVGTRKRATKRPVARKAVPKRKTKAKAKAKPKTKTTKARRTRKKKSIGW